MGTPRRAALRAAVLAALVAAAPRPLSAQASTYQLLQTFSDLLNQIRVNYVDSVTTQHLVRGAIEGMLASLDPHSYYLEHAQSERLDAWRAGRLAATGIVVEGVEGSITVLAVIPGSSAERSHVAAGDRIVAVNDSSVAGLEAHTVQARLLGERGSRIRLRLERGPRLQPDTISLAVRCQDIKPQSVSRSRALAGGIGYVRLAEFNLDAGRELRDAIDRAAAGPGPRRVILDLRGNPGGALVAAQDVLALFLSEGQSAFRTRGRHPDANTDFVIRHNGRYGDARLVVLIDENSASASEAVAGSLQDHDRATLLGRRSFGKALVQRPFLIQPTGDEAWLTIAWVVTPSGRVIQRRYQGLSAGQYEALAGKGGAAGDTVEALRTDSGRIVRGGGGIAPDSVLPEPVPLPLWFVAASDSALDDAVSDSVAATLPPDAAARAAWIGAASTWASRLLPPLLDRVRRRFDIAPRPDTAQGARIARILAARVAEVRWGPDAAQELLITSDPDIAAAAAVLSRPRSAGPPR
ncbi:MAG TPA: S41 family peptidase [Gemmatimonadales bacterium]|nr:S41 family peptidase [Gemmatimonadales bacterium]